ncbi:MAG: TetR/AcrR family transcriptional regulator, partial [Clostridia bacterium]|nr:TetR/AcrR family transcriptional regulator [Clostridia bacterium]
MDKKNMNRRQRMTVRLLEEAYLELLTEKREANVAVLCEQADVNRTTFYRYFRDIEDLSEQMTAGLFDEIFSALDEIGNAGTSANK